MDKELEKLKEEITKAKLKVADAKKVLDIQREKEKLKRELKELNKSSSTKYRNDLLNRSLVSGKKYGAIFGKAIIKQAKLIKQQQIREENKERFLIKKKNYNKKTIKKKRIIKKKTTKKKRTKKK